MTTKRTRGPWHETSGAVSDLSDIYTSESEGMIAQNVRYHDALAIVAWENTVPELIAWIRRCVPQIDHPSDPDRAILRTLLAKLDV